MKRAIPYKWLTAAISILLIVGPSACFLVEDCPKAPPYFQIQGLTVSNLTFTGQGLNPWRTVENNEPIKYDSFFIRFGFEKTYFSSHTSSAGPSLYALSCIESGYKGSPVGVDTIYLVTLQDYNSSYSRNDTLNNILLTNYWTYYVNDFNNFVPLKDYIEENKDGNLQDGAEMKITEPPAETSNDYSFKLIFILQNGERFEKTTDNIRLIR